MSRYRVYVKPFLDDGTYAADFQEITKDVVSVGDPKQAIDNTDFDVGVIKSSGMNIVLRNDHGLYSGEETLRSIFRYSRKNSIIKVTWDYRDYDLIAGFFTAGSEPLGGEYELFRGLINDITSASDIKKQQATFTVLGFETLLDEIEVPFSTINNGDLLSSVIYKCLNQAPFTTSITVSALNISLGTDVAIDDKTNLENKTVGQVLKNILLAGNAVLYIKNLTVYVTSRTPSATVAKTFYGQASNLGIENIINIPKIRDGLNRVFNLWTWKDTSTDVRDTTSLTHYGVRPKDMSLDLINDGSTSKITTILTANKTEFAFPKIELDLEVALDYETAALNILDRVAIDYPTVAIPYDGGELPRYGLVKYGEVRYPYTQWTLTIDISTNFKIMNRKVNIKKQTMSFGLREI